MRRRRKIGSETELVAACLDVLHATGVLAWRCNVGGASFAYKGKSQFVRFGTRGISDIAGVLPGGRALFVECKTTKGRVTPDQEAFLTAMRGAGAAAFVVRSVEELVEQLSASKATAEGAENAERSRNEM